MMNREIKFRAWDNQKKQWYSRNNLLLSLIDDYSLKNINNVDDGLLVNKYSLTQYTGLKDINGVEIYEGDIVKFLVPFREINEIKYTISPVVFLSGAYKVYYIYYENNEKCTYFLNDCDKLEIIGNIYENPELLKEQENETTI